MKPFVPSHLPLPDIDWRALVRLIVQANAELGRYDGVLRTIPNPSLLLSPMTTQEAVLSSKIEGTQANLREVLEYQATPTRTNITVRKRDDIQEIVNYRMAMDEAVESLEKRPLSLNLILNIHARLLDSVRGHNKARGQLRRIQNHIGASSSIETARYVPPEPMSVMKHMDNFERYIHYDEEDRIVQLAIIHAQFEIIHPFLDGNGRVGRILIPLFLYEKQLLSSPTFYLSEYLETNRTEYMDRLLAITENGDWLGWIQFFLIAVAEQANANARKAQRVLSLYDEMKTKVSESTRSRYAIQILDALFVQPFFTSNQFADITNIPKPTTARVLAKLANDDILQVVVEGRGRFSTIFMFDRLFREVESQSFPNQ